MPVLRRVVQRMIVYLAGGVSGNLKPFWSAVCKAVDGGKKYEEATDESMQIFLAGGERRHYIVDDLLKKK